MAKKQADYDAIIARVFERWHSRRREAFEFSRDDLAIAACRLTESGR
ncbi:MAG: hypothetical protein R6V58_00475 [Planctomycetota bacterium]